MSGESSQRHRGPGAGGCPSPPPPPVPDHDLLRLIGAGGYGEVWLARNALGTYRAVKVVYRHAFEDERPFEREFKGIQQFEPISRSHEGLVDILQVGGGDGYFYYVMELADAEDSVGSVNRRAGEALAGGVALAADPESGALTDTAVGSYRPRTLRSDLQRRGRLPVDECVRVGLSLASALDHLHAGGLVHRDVKPSNIIFVGGVPKLADIGLVARAEEADSQVGTLGFIPPEGSGTPGADLFSLGRVLYEIGTGRDRRDFPQLPSNLREMADGQALIEFNEVVLKACENDPGRRYASAAEMRSDLELLLGGRSVRRLRAVERRLALMTRAGLALSGLLAVAGVFYLAARRQAEANGRLAATNAALASANARLAADAVRQLYAAEMNLALQAWDGGNLPRARALLERQRPVDPDLRGFEWSLLEQLCLGDDHFTLRGHDGIVWSVAISPDGTRLVSGGADGSIAVWESGTGRQVSGVSGEGKVVHAVAFSPDGLTIARAGRDDRVTLHDAGSLEVRRSLRGHRDAVRSIAFSSDGRRLASGGEDGRILIWDPGDGRLIESLAETMSVECVVLSPDGSQLAAAGSDTRVHLWDLAKREVRAVAPQRTLLKAAAFSPDGRILAVAGYEGVTELWDVERDQSAGSLGGRAPVDAVAFSPDGRWLATAGKDAAVHLWDVHSRRPVRELRGHTAGVNALAFSRDGGWIASAGDDGTARIWENDARVERRHALVHEGLVNAVAFAPGGRHLATAAGTADELRLWDTSTGEVLARMTTETRSIWSLAYSADGTAIFTGGVDGSLRRWDLEWAKGHTSRQAPREQSRQASRVRQVHRYAVEAVAVSADGRLLATACRGAPVELWDPVTLDAIATLPGEALAFRSAMFSPDGQWLAASGRGSEVWLWNVPGRTLAARLPGHAIEVRSVAFSPDGAILASADDRRVIRFWQVGTWRRIGRMEGHDAPILSLSFAPDGRTLASGSEDGTVKLWNLRLGQEVGTLRGHVSQVKQVAFAPDGSLLATAGGDGMVRLWRAARPAAQSAAQSDLRSR